MFIANNVFIGNLYLSILPKQVGLVRTVNIAFKISDFGKDAENVIWQGRLSLRNAAGAKQIQ